MREFSNGLDGDWNQVSVTTPCPICGADANCRTHSEEAFACCVQRPSDWRLNNGGWLHRVVAVGGSELDVLAGSVVSTGHIVAGQSVAAQSVAAQSVAAQSVAAQMVASKGVAGGGATRSGAAGSAGVASSRVAGSARPALGAVRVDWRSAGTGPSGVMS